MSSAAPGCEQDTPWGFRWTPASPQARPEWTSTPGLSRRNPGASTRRHRSRLPGRHQRIRRGLQAKSGLRCAGHRGHRSPHRQRRRSPALGSEHRGSPGRRPGLPVDRRSRSQGCGPVRHDPSEGERHPDGAFGVQHRSGAVERRGHGKFPDGWDEQKPYLRMVKQPNESWVAGGSAARVPACLAQTTSRSARRSCRFGGVRFTAAGARRQPVLPPPP